MSIRLSMVSLRAWNRRLSLTRRCRKQYEDQLVTARKGFEPRSNRFQYGRPRQAIAIPVHYPRSRLWNSRVWLANKVLASKRVARDTIHLAPDGHGTQPQISTHLQPSPNMLAELNAIPHRLFRPCTNCDIFLRQEGRVTRSSIPECRRRFGGGS